MLGIRTTASHLDDIRCACARLPSVEMVLRVPHQYSQFVKALDADEADVLDPAFAAFTPMFLDLYSGVLEVVARQRREESDKARKACIDHQLDRLREECWKYHDAYVLDEAVSKSLAAYHEDDVEDARRRLQIEADAALAHKLSQEDDASDFARPSAADIRKRLAELGIGGERFRIDRN